MMNVDNALWNGGLWERAPAAALTPKFLPPPLGLRGLLLSRGAW